MFNLFLARIIYYGNGQRKPPPVTVYICVGLY